MYAKICSNCGREFSVLPYRLTTAKFCSMDCSGRNDSVEKRFWAKVQIGEIAICWPWLASYGTRGYGQFRYKGTTRKAHRVAFELYYGIDPKDGDVCHTCDNPPCNNPHHLWLGDASANIADMFAKGRQPIIVPLRGEAHPNSKLTLLAVKRILQTTDSARQLAEEYRVLPATIYAIRKRKNWGHV